jgi:hypothetical protein
MDDLKKHLLEADATIGRYFKPIPKEEEDNWYVWNVNNWGTKWDFAPFDWGFTEDGIHIHFDSAWSPPIALYDFLVTEGWSVDAKYNEPGMGYIGQYTDGSDDYYEYDVSEFDSIKSLPEDLILFGNLKEEHENWKDHVYTDGGF